jgi:hypothetical protein
LVFDESVVGGRFVGIPGGDANDCEVDFGLATLPDEEASAASNGFELDDWTFEPFSGLFAGELKGLDIANVR